MFYTRFLSPTDQKCAESSAFWQFFYYCPPSIQRERSLKCDAKNSTYIYYLIAMHIYRYRYHTLDKRYGFSLSVQPEITSLLRPVFFFKVKKKCFSKVGSLWLVGEVVNHVGLYWSKVAKGYSAFQRRSCFFTMAFFGLLPLLGDRSQSETHFLCP